MQFCDAKKIVQYTVPYEKYISLRKTMMLLKFSTKYFFSK